MEAAGLPLDLCSLSALDAPNECTLSFRRLRVHLVSLINQGSHQGKLQNEQGAILISKFVFAIDLLRQTPIKRLPMPVDFPG